MKLTNFFKDINSSISNIRIKAVARDTRQLQEGCLFFLIPGDNFDIFSCCELIFKKAAAVIVAKDDLAQIPAHQKQENLIVVDDVRSEFKRCVDIFYPLNLAKFNFIGVTGTNGKTTVASCICHLLTNLGEKVAFIGTTGYYYAGKKIDASYTTPDYLILRRLLFDIAKYGIKYVVLEVSSHALAQGRIEGISFKTTIFTNISRDHLDYHHDMKQYFREKLKLFINNPQSIHIINKDARYGQQLLGELSGEKYSYGQDENCDYQIKDYNFLSRNLQFSLRKQVDDEAQQFRVKSRLIGKFNAYNITAALVAVSKLGFSMEEAVEKVISFKGACGRLQQIAQDIFIDYAHTPGALENVLGALAECGYNKIIIVFGCGGSRDRGKRRLMGAIASQLADFSFITTDNPRAEPSAVICRQITQGFSNDNYKIIIDRAAAIEQAIKYKGSIPESALLIAGKGHEQYQQFADKKIEFSDYKVVLNVINKLKNSKK